MGDPVFIPERHELKYIVPEWQVEAIREAIRPYCVLDDHCQSAPHHEYVIESLYLDTPTRDLYRVSRERRASRFKLRVRRYGDSGSQVFLEVKNKSYGMIRKLRAKLPAAGWAARLDGPVPADATPAERDFRHKMARYLLRPTVLVRYQREAWVSAIDDYARVTFDRRIEAHAKSGWDFESDPTRWRPLDHRDNTQQVSRAVVLELKCTLDSPRWMQAVAERVGLKRVGFSKYCTGVESHFGLEALPSFLSRCA